jgi:PAS domain-containing protein
VRAAIQRGIAAAVPFRLEYRIVRRDGTVRTLIARVKPESTLEGATSVLVGVVQDVTDAKNSENERLRLLERVALAAHAGHIGIWERDLRTGIVLGDSNFAELYGLPVPRSISRNVPSIPKTQGSLTKQLRPRSKTANRSVRNIASSGPTGKRTISAPSERSYTTKLTAQ